MLLPTMLRGQMYMHERLQWHQKLRGLHLHVHVGLLQDQKRVMLCCHMTELMSQNQKSAVSIQVGCPRDSDEKST